MERSALPPAVSAYKGECLEFVKLGEASLADSAEAADGDQSGAIVIRSGPSDGFDEHLARPSAEDSGVHLLDLLQRYIDADAFEGSIYNARAETGVDLDRYRGDIRQYFRLLPPDRFPRIVSMADTLTAGDADDRFEFGLDLLVQGLDGHLDNAWSIS